ncbi:VOC family protein [Streptomyces johnsoniae]|uniref:VOC family protein n=1 Tax=Streptomyces johnsoniae TaxID=3075532 RepID=A0ABU2S937_9ACTN|nr:VOC family protein [Streptomyces sp. DSM 41886]MDT0444314.1 VOC family protein [Streptomyces sp. DSM 41886]
MPATGQSHIRIARPSRDLVAAEHFWVSGLGLSVLFRAESEGGPDEHDLLMVGWPDASWHLELVQDAAVEPRPTEEDLLVVYLDEQVPQAVLSRLEAHGGKRVRSRNPYWDAWGATIQDPDGYRLVLSTRGWTNS